MDDRAVGRWTRRLAAGLVVGIALVTVLYVSDQFRPAGPTILEQRVADAEALVRTEPNKVSGRLDLATIYMGAERYTEAFAQYDAVVTAQPDNRTALMGRGMALISLDRLDEASTDFETVIALGKDGEMANADPQLETAYYQVGWIALEQGRAQDALDPLLAALKINRTDADVLVAYADALIQTGNPQRATIALRKAIALVPSGWCDPYAKLSTAYTALNDGAGAGYATGMVAWCENRNAEAKAALEPLVGGPHAVEALVGLGQIAESEGEMAAAAADYSQALALEPDNFTAMAGMSRIGAPSTTEGE